MSLDEIFEKLDQIVKDLRGIDKALKKDKKSAGGYLFPKIQGLARELVKHGYSMQKTISNI